MPSNALSTGSAFSTTTSVRTNFSGAGRLARYTSRRPPVHGWPPADRVPGHYIPKRVTNAGTIRLNKRLLFIANSLKQHVLGLEEIGDGVWSIYFCNVLLARVDEHDYVIRA